jgi:hypothetical protein
MLVGQAHLFDPEERASSEEWPAVSWAGAACPSGYRPVAGGVVFVKLPARPRYREEVLPVDLGPVCGRSQWSYPVDRESMMLVVALPPSYVLERARDAEPVPQGVKAFRSRMVLYWWIRRPDADDRRAVVSWSVRKVDGDLQQQVTAVSHEVAPSGAMAPVELTGSNGGAAASRRWWSSVNSVVSHPLVSALLAAIIFAVLGLWLTFLS